MTVTVGSPLSELSTSSYGPVVTALRKRSAPSDTHCVTNSNERTLSFNHRVWTNGKTNGIGKARQSEETNYNQEFHGELSWFKMLANYFFCREMPARREKILFLKDPAEGLGTSTNPIE